MNRTLSVLVFLSALGACAPYQPEAIEPSPTPVAVAGPPAGAAPGQGSQADDLTTSARTKARAGDCDAARALADKVRALDPEYYRAFVVPDPVITRCWAGNPPSSAPSTTAPSP